MKEELEELREQNQLLRQQLEEMKLNHQTTTDTSPKVDTKAE